jgi:hypothetical protein
MTVAMKSEVMVTGPRPNSTQARSDLDMSCAFSRVQAGFEGGSRVPAQQ